MMQCTDVIGGSWSAGTVAIHYDRQSELATCDRDLPSNSRHFVFNLSPAGFDGVCLEHIQQPEVVNA